MNQFDRIRDGGDDRSSEQADLVRGDVVPAGARVEERDARPRVGPAIGLDHALAVQSLSASLTGALRHGARHLLVQQPLKLRRGDTAWPDICVLRDDEVLTSDGRPQREAIQLIVEVSSEALPQELDKLERYALAGVPEVWIVDLPRHRVLAYQDPSGNTFAKRQLWVAPERMKLASGVELKLMWRD